MVDKVGGSSGAGRGGGAADAGGAASAADRTRDAARAGEATATKDVSATRDAGLSAKDTAEVEAAVRAESPEAEAVALEGDSFERDAPTTPGEATAPADADAVAPAEPTEITPEAMAAYDAVDARLRDGAWRASPEAAATVAAEARAALAGLPADQRAEAQAQLMGPVNDFTRDGLVDPNTGRLSADRVRTAGAFADLIDQRSADALAGHLRTAQEQGNVAARDEIARTLDTAARTNVSTTVQTVAARSLLAGPVEVVRDALAGDIAGLSVESMAHLSRTRGDLDSDQRLRDVGARMDPSVTARLDAYGVQAKPQTPDAPGVPEAVHVMLDIAGLVPGLGEFADGLNAELYRQQGRYADAAISAAGMITGLGSVGTGGRLLSRLGRRSDEAADAVGSTGTAARLTGEARELAAEREFQRLGMDARRWNQEINGTDIDLMLSTPRGRYGVMVGGDAKGLRNGALDEGAIQESLRAFRRADEALRDVDGPFRADGLGAVMAFPRGTDPRVLDRFIQELGPQRVLMF
jgi:hypothetical protein